jgi:hypothetical protein
MSKKCEPGVICIESVTFVFIIFIILLFFYLFRGIFNQLPHFTFKFSPGNNSEISKSLQETNINNPHNMFFPPSLSNPFIPPLKDGVYHHKGSSDPRGMPPIHSVPINMKTRGYDTNYSQMGILTRINGDETILPLVGRPLHANRGKWQYYCMSDKFNSIRLPISKNGKSCTSEYGCNDLFNGDTVYVEGYQDAFKVTIYENESPRYIPYL